ncbi:hypothetical protein OsccyDRAFT_0690 [Leptolyngbyaceae cyanobacterium JSC-12]|nr:hypothetical protein OsccyDRAFT_0690 [Leptolyngbyaceae cyanobacterium JSC-12]
MRPDLGDLCHFRSTYVPVAAITDLNGNIIFSNEQKDLNGNAKWSVSGIRIMTTRFWSAASAYAILTTEALSQGLPEYPTNAAGIERELCLWQGYLPALRPIVPQDLGSRLIRRFVGVVDVVKAVGSATGGYTINIQMRDRMKWLMDTVVTYNPTTDKGVGSNPLRSNIILEVAQRGIGQVEGEQQGSGCAVCGKKILWDQNYLYDLGDKGKGSSPNISSVPPANLWYQPGGPLAASTRTQSLKVNKNPYFRIYTTRAPINLQQGTNFLISQQIPVDILKFLAMQEVYPTEVFQDSRDGNLYYAPRANDTSGLKDPKRFYRTYYFRDYPQTYDIGGGNAAPPDPNQLLIAFSEEQSSLGLKTNFWVHKNAPTAQGASGDEWSIHLRVKPKILEGVDYACKFTRIFDDTITTAEEAAVVALNAARIMGKEVRAATAVMLGDPSITPGEVIQILGSPIQPGRGFTNALQDRQQFEQFDKAYNDNLKVYAEQAIKNAGASAPAIQGAEVTLPIHDGSSARIKIDGKSQENQDRLICEASSQTNAASEPPTMWRVEAVIEKFNISGKGWTTEVALVSPF